MSLEENRYTFVYFSAVARFYLPVRYFVGLLYTTGARETADIFFVTQVYSQFL
jgi:hypothetical protein